MHAPRYTTLIALLALAPLGETAWAAERTGPETCYIVADSNSDAVDGNAEDLLTRVTRADSDPATNEENIGSGTGTFNIEAIALQPGTGVLFAADGGTIGTLDTTSGEFTAIGDVGSGSGALGTVALNDIDGLNFDPTTGLLYGTERRASGEDLLILIDPVTGQVSGDGMAGADYVVIPAVDGLPDIDDVAIDPLDGQMYAIANDDGRSDHLVRIDKVTGATTDVGVLGVTDMEGLSFAGGQLIGTTGKNRREEGIWDIDKATGAADNRRPLDNGRDYEGFACLNAPNPLPPPGPPGPPNPPEPAISASEPALPVVEDEQEFRRAPAGVILPAPPATVAPAATVPVAAPELPRTGSGSHDALVRLGAAGLALGGFGLAGGSSRRRRPRSSDPSAS